ncbi:MAG TPA: PEGA domain-containing protein [bacterium]|nr:PEGA domain-containing protein [bacterium]
MPTFKILSISILITMISFSFNISASEGSGPSGTLTVETKPSGLNVYVDGKIAGKTPLKNYAVPAGKRILSVETEPCFKSVLYYSWNRPVYVEEGKDTYIEITPSPVITSLKVGGIEVNGSSLKGTEVYVDGVNVGTQPGSFDVPVCSKILEVTDESGKKVIYRSELDLLKGVVTQKNEKNYEITPASVKAQDSVILSQTQEGPDSGEMSGGEVKNKNTDVFQKKIRPAKKNINVLGPYKWIGTSLILAGAVSAGLGGLFDYKALKEFDKYEDMGDKDTIRQMIEEGSFDEEEYISERDGHYKKGKDYSVARTVLYAAGGAMFVTGVILLFVPGVKKNEKNTSFLLIPSVEGLFISAEISF